MVEDVAVFLFLARSTHGKQTLVDINQYIPCTTATSNPPATSVFFDYYYVVVDAVVVVVVFLPDCDVV